MKIQIQPLFPILLTALRLLRASGQNDDLLGNAIARSVIIHCPLLVESLANSLLLETSFNTTIQADLERLSTMAKLELCANLAGKGNFARGDQYVQVFSDLTKLRNDYVHPKRSSSTDVQLNGDSYMISISQKWSALDIAKSPEIWSLQDAIEVFRKTLSSLDFYLMDTLQICNRRIERIFLHHVTDDNGKSSLVTVAEKPWALEMPEKVPLPRFLKRLESHAPFCSKDASQSCTKQTQHGS